MTKDGSGGLARTGRFGNAGFSRKADRSDISDVVTTATFDRGMRKLPGVRVL